MPSSDIYTLKLKHETPKAWLFLDLASGRECWLPKSQVSVSAMLPKTDCHYNVEIPDWLAEKAGLV